MKGHIAGLAFSLLILTSPAWALDAEWVRGCEGYADIRGTTSPAQAEREALNKARSKAIEKASGLRINDRFIHRISENGQGASETTIKELAVALDGVILDEANKQWSTDNIQGAPGEPPFQRLKIRADFRVAKLPPPDPNFTVDLKLNRGSLVASDPLKLFVTTSENAYLSVFNLAADDRVYVIYPNAYCPSLFAPRNKKLTLPNTQDGFDLQPCPLPGHKEDTEVIRVIASRNPLRLPNTDQKGTLSVKEFFQWLYAMPQSQWTEAEQVYTVYSENR